MKAPFRLARLLRFLCDLGLGCGIAGLSLYVIWAVWLLVSPAIMGGTRPTVGGAVRVGVGESGYTESLPIRVEADENKSLFSPKLFETTGELQFRTADWSMQILLSLSKVLIIVLVLGILYLTRQFLVDAINGAPFTFDNAQRLKWLGWLLLGISLAKPLVDYLAGRRILAIADIKGLTLTPWVDAGFSVICILAASFILILSAIFRHGVDLENERSLTV